jgi:predicted permease
MPSVIDPEVAMGGFVNDLRLAVRSLRKAPGLTVGVILTLALGMTLCLTASMVIKAYLLEGLPYPHAERLFSIRYAEPGGDAPESLERLDWRSLDDVIEHRVAWDLDVFYLLGGENAEAIRGAWVTDGFMQGLGIVPVIGQSFAAEDFQSGGPNLALISHRVWVTRFAGDPGVVGKTFSAYVSDRPQEAEAFRIVGVLPQSFWHLNPYTDILTPLRAPTYPYLARLQPGVTADYAATRIAALVRGGGGVAQDWRPQVLSTHGEYVARTRPVLESVMVSGALVFLVACANVAGLLIVRGIRRRKEVAVRTALGARSSAIARMLLAEGIVMAAAAITLAVVASTWIVGWLAPALQQQLGRTAPGGAAAFALDMKALAIAAAVAAFTAVICSLAPLAPLAYRPILPLLQTGARGATDSRGSLRLRTALIVLEIAASVTLAVCSMLMIRTVVAMGRTDLGFRADHVLLSSLTLRQNRYPDAESRREVMERALTRLAAIPGVDTVALSMAWPVQQGGTYPVEGTGASGRMQARASIDRVTAAYFSTLAIKLVSGRVFDRSDTAGSEQVAVVSETLARRLWPSGDAVGSRIRMPSEDDAGRETAVERLVIGVVRDVRQGPSDDDFADIYESFAQSPSRFAFALLRTAGDPAASANPLRAAFREIDPEIVVQNPRALSTIVSELTSRPRFMASVFAVFAIAAAVLTLVGVYGVIAYAVRQREREVAVRMALGAQPSGVTALFLRQGAPLLLAGILLGALGARAAGRLLQNQLFGVSGGDLGALAGAAALFAAAGLAAIWWPARRAAVTDPAIVLRSE